MMSKSRDERVDMYIFILGIGCSEMSQKGFWHNLVINKYERHDDLILILLTKYIENIEDMKQADKIGKIPQIYSHKPSVIDLYTTVFYCSLLED